MRQGPGTRGLHQHIQLRALDTGDYEDPLSASSPLHHHVLDTGDHEDPLAASPLHHHVMDTGDHED